MTIQGVVCASRELARGETDHSVNVTFEPAEEGQEPEVDAERACRVAIGHGGADATSAEVSFGLLTWPEWRGGVDHLPVWRVIFEGACVPNLGVTLPPGVTAPSDDGCAGNEREAVLVDATTGEYLASYASEDLG